MSLLVTSAAALLGMKSLLKSFVQKSSYQTMSFAKFFVTMNGHAYKLFKNIFNDFQTDGKRGDNYGLT